MERTGWLPVPSLNYRYEVDPRGRLRNAKTKRHLRPYTRGIYSAYGIQIDGKRQTVSVYSLLWEVHGKIPVYHKRGRKPKKV